MRAVRLGADEQRCDIGNHLSYFASFIDYALDDPEWGEQIRAYLREKTSGRLILTVSCKSIMLIRFNWTLTTQRRF